MNKENKLYIFEKNGSMIAVIMAFCAIIPAWINYDVIALDGISLYIPVAKLFLNGNFHDALFGPLKPPLPLPLYEFFIFIVAGITHFDFETSGRLVSSLFYIVGALGIYKLTAMIYNKEFCKSESIKANAESEKPYVQASLILIIPVIFYISNRILLSNAVDCLKETLLVCIVVWGNYFILKGVYGDNKVFPVVSGSVILLSGIMVRSTSIIFLSAWFLLWCFHKKERLLLRIIICFIIVGTAFLIAYLIGERFILRNNQSIKVLFDKKILDNILLLPDSFIGFTRSFLKRSNYFVGLLGLAGFCTLFKLKYTRFMIITLVLVTLVCVLAIPEKFSDRYIIAPIIMLIPISALCIVRAINNGNGFFKTVAIICILLAPVMWAGKAFKRPDPEMLFQKEAGRWILDHAGPCIEIVSNRPRVIFYSECLNSVVLVDSPKDNIKRSNKTSIIGQRFPGKPYYAYLEDMQCLDGRLRVPVAIDTYIKEGQGLKEYLEDNGIMPDKKFGTINIWLPASYNCN